ncbi:MAG: hypothetical protein ACRDZ1_00695 [Acidimicrobiia bacterium]
METLFLLLPAFGCAAMMIACAAMMWGGHRMRSRRSDTDDASSTETTGSEEPARVGAAPDS